MKFAAVMSRVRGTRFIAWGALWSTVAGAPIAMAQELPTEEVSFVFHNITWTNAATQRLQAELIAEAERVARSNPRVSEAVREGRHRDAARAAIGGTMDVDDWSSIGAVVRGCDATGALCFVITCRNCSGGR